MKKKVLSVVLAGMMSVGLAACGSSNQNAASTEKAAAAASTTDATTESAENAAVAETGTSSSEIKYADNAVVINVGYENAVTEPAAKAAEKWKELVAEKSGGTIDLELFPNSTLGKKNDLIDQMLLGQNVITVADGAFLADYGVKDFGFFYAPYAFDNWDQLWTVLDSDWYSDLKDIYTALLRYGKSDEEALEITVKYFSGLTNGENEDSIIFRLSLPSLLSQSKACL